MSDLWGEDATLEEKLLRMPFQKMMGAIESIESLDRYLISALHDEKPDDWQEQVRKVHDRQKKRAEFVSFRIALDAGLPLTDAVSRGKLAGFDLDNNLRRIFPAPPKPNVGLELCAMALADILLNSHVESRRYSRRYFQEGRLRALVEMYERKMHGNFLVLYPDGNLWARGFYRNNSIVSESMQFYMPNGALVERGPIPNNVLPFKPKSVLEPK